MSEFSRKQPKMHAKVMDLVESGLSAEEIIAKFNNETMLAAATLNDVDIPETFSDQIHIISQALAYREPISEDIGELYALLRDAYDGEVHGEESFRTGESITMSSIESVFEDKSYHWLILEAPSGKGVEKDGLILGCCCYSVNGVSRKNGTVLLLLLLIFS